MQTLKTRHLRALTQAVDKAEEWRGSLFGHPDPIVPLEFEKLIASAREALALLRQQHALRED